MVAVALHLRADVAQVEVAHLRPAPVEAVLPLVEELVYDQHAVAVGPVEHVARVGVVRQSDAVAAHVARDGREAAVPGGVERGRAERAEVGVQAHSVDIYAPPVHGQAAVGAELNVAYAEGGLVDVCRRSRRNCSGCWCMVSREEEHAAHGLVEHALAHVPELRLGHADVLPEGERLARAERCGGLARGHGAPLRVNDVGHEAAEHRVASVVAHSRLHGHERTVGRNLRRGDVSAVPRHVQRVCHVEPHVAVDALAVVPPRAFVVGIVV